MLMSILHVAASLLVAKIVVGGFRVMTWFL